MWLVPLKLFNRFNLISGHSVSVLLGQFATRSYSSASSDVILSSIDFVEQVESIDRGRHKINGLYLFNLVQLFKEYNLPIWGESLEVGQQVERFGRRKLRRDSSLCDKEDLSWSYSKM